jgi:hypothetical protein
MAVSMLKRSFSQIDTLITNEEDDEQFQRITTIIDRLIEEAQASVEYKISHGGRVLSQYDQSGKLSSDPENSK